MYKLIRDVKNTIYYYLKHVTLKPYIEESVFNLVQYDGSNVYIIDKDLDYNATPSDNGRGFYPFNTTSSGVFGDCVLASGIEVYDSLNVLPASSYDINFVDASVRMYTADMPVAIKANWHYVAVIEGWPDGEQSNLPFVILEFEDIKAKGYQLGGGKQPLFNITVFVFANNSAELDSIVGNIFDGLYLKSSLLYMFPHGDIFLQNGFYNDMFSCTVYNNPSVLYFENVSVKYTRFKLYDSHDVNMYRAQVDFVVTAYIEPE